MDWRVLGSMEAAVAQTSELFLPKWMAIIISLALFLLLQQPYMQLYYLRRDRSLRWRRIGSGLKPWVSNKFNTPGNAVLFITFVSMLGILIGTSIQNYANVTVLGFMIMQILIGLSVWKIPRAMPENYARAPFKLNKFWRGFFCWGLVAISAVFLVIGVVTSLESTLIYFSCLIVGVFWYFYRRAALRKQGSI